MPGPIVQGLISRLSPIRRLSPTSINGQVVARLRDIAERERENDEKVVEALVSEMEKGDELEKGD